MSGPLTIWRTRWQTIRCGRDAAAWNAFVSGSSRVVLITDVRLEGESQTGGISMGLRFNITHRFQVRR